MRRLVAAILFVGFMFAVAGCSAPNAAFVKAVDGYRSAVLPEYRAYVAADPNLESATKQIRIETANSFDRLVDEAKKQVEGK